MVYEFPEREGFPPLKLTWYEGQPPARPKELEEGRELAYDGGVLFKGDKGTIMCGVYGDSPRLIPETAMKAYQRPDKSLPRIKGSHGKHARHATRARDDPGEAGPGGRDQGGTASRRDPARTVPHDSLRGLPSEAGKAAKRSELTEILTPSPLRSSRPR